MKKIFINYKILVNGFNPVNKFTIDGFELKYGSFKEESFYFEKNKVSDEMEINMNLYLFSCLTDKSKLEYNYFEPNNLFEIEVSNKTNSKDYPKILRNKPEILERVNKLEQKLRIIFNTPIFFQNIIIEFYDENKLKLGFTQLNKSINFWNRLNYAISSEEVTNNSRFNLDLDKFIHTKNPQFNRAVEFYNESFNSEKISIRFILIFSALESIFNLNEKKIAEKLGEYSANLLVVNNNLSDKEKIKSDIKRLYNKRCNYVHGSKKNPIKMEDEILLRRYARMIIISYWLIILNTNESAKEILMYAKGIKEMDLTVKLEIITATAQSFYEQQYNCIKFLENEGIKIPEKTKKNLLSSVNE